MNFKELMQTLPHRFPFLLVDRVLELDVEKQYIKAQKCVSGNEAFFQGHFPGAPVVPGVLIIEALAQAGGIMAKHLGYEKVAVLLSVNDAKFRHRVIPGDVLILEIQGQHFSSRGGRVEGKASVGEKCVASAQIAFALVNIEEF